ncbi:PDC sensor domain-containing protein [Myxococcus sp. RHSTA-1-4]|uniref:PDC sensor domain-containing protein n=1 Tax=Myxococcus sp. RHSTA-1-4 TaxID=2874601 RepID=UPI001CBCEB34|nr:PDC sensor domain-containing protein [Myxococcus sp. RHSTA-1-4]MBZ4417347.1 PDC sensor domain-containing protein [Myxococcus sp. RHSTA-1-4]
MSWLGLAVVVLAQLPADGAAQLQKVDRMMPALRRMATDPEVVAAVRAQNARRVPLATIQEQDAAWQATPQLTAFKQQVLGSACSRVLNRHRARLGIAVAEAFAMDDQGALVGATRRTSDFWQGDEAKFQVPYARGETLREKPFFDESSQAYVIQLSLPVRDGDRTIGALTIGLSLLDL